MKSPLVAATAALCLLGQGATAVSLTINDDSKTE
jgi:mannan endo-1,6-alpha-mannosidase